MNKIGVDKYESTFFKLTKTFLLIAVLPMMLICMAFLVHYSNNAETMTISNMIQMSYYLETNVESVVESIDETLEYVYEYRSTDNETLYEILENDKIGEQQKNIYINTMLQNMMSSNGYISSIRFVVSDNTAYSIFKNSEKSIKLAPAFCDNKLYDKADSYQQLTFAPCRSEAYYINNSVDNVFSMVRNYFDVSTTANAQSKIMGTIYADINEDIFDDYTSSLDVGEHGQIFIYSPEKGTYLYSTNEKVYSDEINPLAQYNSYFEDGTACVRLSDTRMIYTPLADTGYYIVLQTSVADIRSGYMENISFMIIILLIFLFVLVAIYSLYSGRISGPARTLKKAMQEVRAGNFDVEVDIRTNDEFQYLGEGFNKMLHDLKYYVNQVYVAKLNRNKAELNALKMQIQPHFLYNTLDVIRMTALENDDPQTAELIESLSDQMRYVTDNSEVVTIAKELDNIRAYFAIILVRFNRRLNLKINVNDEDLELKILKFAVQPIVENAVKHGLKEKPGMGNINVDVSRADGRLEISVMDDGVGIELDNLLYLRKVLDSDDPDEDERNYRVGVGLKNISDLIRMTYGDEYGINIESYVGIGTIVTLRLPIIEEEEESNA